MIGQFEISDGLTPFILRRYTTLRNQPLMMDFMYAYDALRLMRLIASVMQIENCLLVPNVRPLYVS